jgi:hypothetical protein
MSLSQSSTASIHETGSGHQRDHSPLPTRRSAAGRPMRARAIQWAGYPMRPRGLGGRRAGPDEVQGRPAIMVGTTRLRLCEAAYATRRYRRPAEEMR